MTYVSRRKRRKCSTRDWIDSNSQCCGVRCEIWLFAYLNSEVKLHKTTAILSDMHITRKKNQLHNCVQFGRMNHWFESSLERRQQVSSGGMIPSMGKSWGDNSIRLCKGCLNNVPDDGVLEIINFPWAMMVPSIWEGFNVHSLTSHSPPGALTYNPHIRPKIE